MNQQTDFEAAAVDRFPTIVPLIDQGFDAWDGDAAALLGVPPGAVEPDAEADDLAWR